VCIPESGLLLNSGREEETRRENKVRRGRIKGKETRKGIRKKTKRGG